MYWDLLGTQLRVHPHISKLDPDTRSAGNLYWSSQLAAQKWPKYTKMRSQYWHILTQYWLESRPILVDPLNHPACNWSTANKIFCCKSEGIALDKHRELLNCSPDWLGELDSKTGEARNRGTAFSDSLASTQYCPFTVPSFHPKLISKGTCQVSFRTFRI